MTHAQRGATGATAGNSYAEILRSSFIMGGVSALTMIFSLVRTKFVALIIGVTGTGLLANLAALQALMTSASGFGMSSSAVREIARACAASDEAELGRVVLALRRCCWATGALGALITFTTSTVLSRLSFGTSEYEWPIALLSATVLLGNLQGGQVAVIQGTRRMGDLARVQVLSALSTTLLVVICLYAFGLHGLVPGLVLGASAQLLLSWWYCRRIPIPKVILTMSETWDRARSMARLGFAIMWSGLLGSAVIYGVTALVANQLDLQALGFYGAAYALSGVFVNFVLGAMASDFYPRLAGLSRDPEAVNRLVNEQTEVGILLATPGLAATIALAPWILQLFYTREFLPAAPLLQCFCLGCLGRVISWPLGYALLARSRAATVVLTETSCSTLHLLLVFVALHWFGLIGAAIAFVSVYVIYSAVVYGIAARNHGFSWTAQCVQQMIVAFALLLLSWASTRANSLMVSLPAAFLLLAISSIFSVHALTDRLGADHRISRFVARVPLLRYATTRRAP